MNLEVGRFLIFVHKRPVLELHAARGVEVHRLVGEDSHLRAVDQDVVENVGSPFHFERRAVLDDEIAVSPGLEWRIDIVDHPSHRKRGPIGLDFLAGVGRVGR